MLEVILSTTKGLGKRWKSAPEDLIISFWGWFFFSCSANTTMRIYPPIILELNGIWSSESLYKLWSSGVLWRCLVIVFMYPSYGKYARDLAKWWGKSLKSVNSPSTWMVHSGFLWISPVERNMWKGNWMSGRKTWKPAFYFWEVADFHEKETQKHHKQLQKSIFHDIPMTWRWRRLFYMTNDRCWGEAATKFRVTVELWAKGWTWVNLQTRGFCWCQNDMLEQQFHVGS